MDKVKIKRTGNIIVHVLLYVFLVLSIFSVILTLMSKKSSDGAAELFGYQMRIVSSDSMAESEYTDVSGFKIKDIPVRSMVFVKVMPDDPDEADEWYRSLKVGDVLTFRYVYSSQVTITHRITSIEEKETGGFIIELIGDNRNSEGNQMSQIIDTSVPNNTNYVIGKVTGQSYLLGVIMSFIMQPVGIVLVIMIPCFLIMLLEVMKITKILVDDKKSRDRKEDDEKEKEIEELRRKLAELEAKNEEDKDQ